MLENLQKKARLVSNGNETAPHSSSNYESVVSFELVRIRLTVAALNGLNMKLSGIENAYLTAPTTENYMTFLVQKFVKIKGKLVLL